MQIESIDISAEGRVLVRDHVFWTSDCEGIIKNKNTGEKALLSKCDVTGKKDKIEAFKSNVLSKPDDEHRIKNIICPEIYKQSDGEETVYFALTEFPDEFGTAEENIYKLSESVLLVNSEFSIISRIKAAINFSEILNVLKDYIGKNIFSVHPEDIYINIKSGEVYILIEKWLDTINALNEVEDFGFSPEWYLSYDMTFGEADMRFFAAYVIFRLLCTDEPFDGKETLLKFPLLTDEAIRDIHRNKYGFSLIRGSNSASKYIGQGLIKKWNKLPIFLRKEFEKNFTVGINFGAERTEIPRWLQLMQKVRDCLISDANEKRFKFCDFNVPSKILFMVINDYEIPVWPKKAVYWYHIGIPFDKTKNGVAAGIIVKNGLYYFNNLSESIWRVIGNKEDDYLYPGKSIQIVEGLTVESENGKSIKIVNNRILNENNELNDSEDTVIDNSDNTEAVENDDSAISDEIENQEASNEADDSAASNEDENDCKAETEDFISEDSDVFQNSTNCDSDVQSSEAEIIDNNSDDEEE